MGNRDGATRRRTGMVARSCRRVVTAVMSLVVTACGTSDPPSPVASAERDPASRYRAVVHVLETPTQPPTACLGFVLTSEPPAGCTGIAVTGWNWAELDGVDVRSGTRQSGLVELVGTVDGRSFTLTQPPRPAPGQRADTGAAGSRPPGCAPENRTTSDPARTELEDLEAARRAAEVDPDFVDFWLSDAPVAPSPAATGTPPATTVSVAEKVLTVQFRADVERHTKEIAELWGGALCVGQREPYRWTGVEASAILRSREAVEAGVWTVSVFYPYNDRPTRVEVDVLVDDMTTRRWIEQRFGTSQIELHGLLEAM